MKRWWLCLALVSCGDNKQQQGPVDSPAPDGEVDAPPIDPFATLQGTGLCDDAGCMTISADVKEYEPRFPLYSDGAAKRRWMQLPAGTQIDTSNMDRWVFPIGTKFWKEFTRDGTRVETRFITKLLADDDDPQAWKFFTYQWNATQDEATPITSGAMNANGTDHDIPSRAQCKDCHDGLRPSRVLGFQALQLDYDATAPLVDLEDLIADGTLTVDPTTGTPGTRFVLGSTTPFNATERAALGYLHANCGHCHNPTSTTHDIVPVEFLLDTTKLQSVTTTPAFVSAVDQKPDQTCLVDDPLTVPNDPRNYPLIIVAGESEESCVIARMRTTGVKRMPKIASETPDNAGIAAVAAWIDSL